MGVKDIWSKGALAEELDALSLDMAGVSDKIGETTDTGGTDSSGSLMAKANTLLYKHSWVNANLNAINVSPGQKNILARYTAIWGEITLELSASNVGNTYFVFEIDGIDNKISSADIVSKPLYFTFKGESLKIYALNEDTTTRTMRVEYFLWYK